MEAMQKPDHEGIILCGLDKRIVEYLEAHSDDRYVTLNRLSLALGSNELLVSNALRTLTKARLISERVDSSMGVTTYHLREQPDDLPTIQTPKSVTPTPTAMEKSEPAPSPIVEKLSKQPEGITEAYWCGEPGCKRWFDSKVGRADHRRFAHNIHERNIGRHRSKKSLEIDAQIRKLYPKKTPSQIADALGISYPAIAARLHKMHEKGEIKDYCGPKPQSCPPGLIEPVREEIAPQRIHSIFTPSSFNIGQLLKVNSENQVAIVNATLEVIDERGSEYEVTINRISKGLILTKELIGELIETLKYRIEEINEVSEDARQDDSKWFEDLMKEQRACEFILAKIHKDTNMLEEKEDVIEKSG